MFSVQALQSCCMHTRDGVRLDADVYVPEGEGPFPVLLMRQPYGRAIASTIVYAHPRWYAAHGYIVVIQDVRGRGTSEGAFSLFAYEVADGEDTVKWAAQLPKSDGQVGMYGFSYQGMTQLYVAQAQPKALKAIAPAMTGYHLYEDWAYENGALCLQLGLTWAIQLAAETARIEENVETYQKLVAAAKHLPLSDTVPACPEVLKGIDSFFHDWVANPAPGDYWQKLTPQLREVDLPTLHIGGWFDPYLRGDLRLYQEMKSRGDYSHYLCIGPWGHIPWGHKVGTVDFGSEAMSLVDRLQVNWFDHVLKKKLLSVEASPACVFEMGRNQWRRPSYWPVNGSAPSKHDVKTYFLGSSGLSNIREDSGCLLEDADDFERVDAVVHDPWNPAPALGGHCSIPSGVFERTAVDARGDVLTYTSLRMKAEIRVMGVVELVCAIAATTPSYDLCAVLSRVCEGDRDKSKQVYNLTQGYCRIDPVGPVGASQTITLKLHPTCFNLMPGESLRLSLSAACFPAYPVNPGTGAQPHEARMIDAQIITLKILLGGEKGARINLPIVNSDG